MLNQERICEMTRLAIFDKEDGEECKPMIQYFRSDYIAKELLKSLITGTIAFFVIVGIAVLYRAEELMDQLNSMDIRKTLAQGVLCYAVCMAVYLLITYAVYYIRYTRGRQKVKKYYKHLKKVNKIYREEEQM
ncbi:MAG: hypothetical protein HFJ04_07420 [Lachnospiraceae bacterium]|nr:hypothetical protein [Lachnospiraceae bacterium]